MSARWLALAWLALILAQAILGAATVLTDKAADVATAHVLLGALSLATGAMLSIVIFRESVFVRHEATGQEPVLGARPSAVGGLH